MMNDRHEGQSFKTLPHRQKVAVVSLSIVAISILVVWFWQSSNRINGPFRASSSEIAQAKKAAEEKAALELAENNKDTDHDGLTDAEEKNNYKTSPYLEDTDGDGVSDFNEIKLGKDPLCAEGTNCSLAAGNETTEEPLASSTTTTTPAENVDQELLIKALSGQGDAETMRQILLQGGADPTQVNVLSDDDLMTIYADVLKSQSPEIEINTSTNTSTNQ